MWMKKTEHNYSEIIRVHARIGIFEVILIKNQQELFNRIGFVEIKASYLVVQLLVASNSQRKDGARASCVAYGFVPVLYGSETWQQR